jgi:hypothetical protein
MTAWGVADSAPLASWLNPVAIMHAIWIEAHPHRNISLNASGCNRSAWVSRLNNALQPSTFSKLLHKLPMDALLHL